MKIRGRIDGVDGESVFFLGNSDGCLCRIDEDGYTCRRNPREDLSPQEREILGRLREHAMRDRFSPEDPIPGGRCPNCGAVSLATCSPSGSGTAACDGCKTFWVEIER